MAQTKAGLFPFRDGLSIGHLVARLVQQLETAVGVGENAGQPRVRDDHWSRT